MKCQDFRFGQAFHSRGCFPNCYITALLRCSGHPGLNCLPRLSGTYDGSSGEILANTTKLVSPRFAKYLTNCLETLRQDLCLCCRRTRRRRSCPIARSSRQGSAFVSQEPSANGSKMVKNGKPPLPQGAGWIRGWDRGGKIHQALSQPLPLGVAHSYDIKLLPTVHGLALG